MYVDVEAQRRTMTNYHGDDFNETLVNVAKPLMAYLNKVRNHSILRSSSSELQKINCITIYVI